ncbi:MAG TPA: hybrid sensor histidine kinase/response regulator [Cyanobacteria bacterium UBA11149]|nr:hybrid sensor histidine kinase/response regulator [Cyanobacteria bacterium UBA11367]HBE60732.1 hybrid sensor histidine kinase/response regulator [Cyanobacteria bacterium UBA11366]HBK65463.1 hybrid sensor histidine kinase/response regulator [Cyanobacteria bacterium UBA11166]HBR72460.1 hybrid sensor histidine kinase/response regulator [Cyanobacteria bacterium UBA11159]HBS68269.1 hybrid sensor histidine kinase/response regulator [Cyanobacteria bacterium UBA11153]HBW91390.1 hybrid sensor histid
MKKIINWINQIIEELTPVNPDRMLVTELGQYSNRDFLTNHHLIITNYQASNSLNPSGQSHSINPKYRMINNEPTIQEQGYQYFLQEAQELLQVIERELLTLREDYNINKIHNLMRTTHTLKGAAASVGLETIKTVSHYLEDIFKALFNPDLSIDAEVEALLFEGYECLRLPITAQLTGGQVNDGEILDRTAAIFAQLQEKLGDCFNSENEIPSSVELGFDVTESIFEMGVSQRLEQIADAIATGDPHIVADMLRVQAEVFIGLAESMNLPGFGAIAQTAIAALDLTPDLAIFIAQTALADFKKGQQAVLNGDRARGGEPSLTLQQLAGLIPSSEEIPPFQKLEIPSAIPDLPEEKRDNFDLPEDSGLQLPTFDSINHEPEVTEVTNEELEFTLVQNGESVTLSHLADSLGLQWSLEEFQQERLRDLEFQEFDPSLAEFQKFESEVQEANLPELTESEFSIDESPLSDLNLPGFQESELNLAPSQSSTNLSESQEKESANILLESIWGTAPDLPTSDNMSGDEIENSEITSTRIDEQNEIYQDGAEAETQKETEIEASWAENAIAKETSPVNIHIEAEKPETKDFSSPLSSATPSVPATPPTSPSSNREKESTSVSETVRVNVEHLESLNYSIGELLTNQNRQSLENEQMRLAVRSLISRLQQHQRLLDQLQDWYDREFNWSRQRWNWQLGMVHEPGDLKIRKSSFTFLNHPSLITNQFDPLELENYHESGLLIQSIIDDAVQLSEATEAIDLFARSSQQTMEKQRRLLTSTRDTIVEARMLPLGEIFSRFPRVLKQLETLHKKPIFLDLRGNDVLVDKTIAQKLYDPLLHLVRNAFDHGIESPAIRQQRGKSQEGNIAISAYYRGKHLVIEVGDDGQGLDFDLIRQRAVERKLIDEDNARLFNESQLTDLLFEPGFSTTFSVNDLSGRGVGLDVVRSQIQSLQGSVVVESTLYWGTTFRLLIPLSLTIAKLLLIQANDSIYALLSDAIEQIIIPQPNQIRSWEDGKVLRWGKGNNEELIPIFQLSNALDYSSPRTKNISIKSRHYLGNIKQDKPIILISHQDKIIGLEVDQLIGEQELVIRPLGATIVPPSYVYGGSILPDGHLTLVIDGSALMDYLCEKQNYNATSKDLSVTSAKLHQRQISGTEEKQLPGGKDPTDKRLAKTQEVDWLLPKLVLLVDDSITVRQTVTLTLQKSGYQVLQAKDGYEAIEQLQNNSNIQLVICDIEMPRMNGFEFLKYRQQDPDLTNIPVVILTSRSGEKHRTIASELGATAYISKPYLEHHLLTTLADVFPKTPVGS